MSIDGTGFPITQKGPTFTSHEYAGKPALRYELGIDILMVGGPLIKLANFFFGLNDFFMH